MIEIPNDATLEQIAQVASEEGEPLTRNQVAAVLAAFRAILQGDEIGTMRRNPENGDLAIRVVDEHGLHLWRVMPMNGSAVYNDLQPTLVGWPLAEVSEK